VEEVNDVMIYEVVFFDGWGMMPAYYLVQSVEGPTPEQALAANLEGITREIRERFGLHEGLVHDKQIQETVYALRDNGLVSLRDVAGLR